MKTICRTAVAAASTGANKFRRHMQMAPMLSNFAQRPESPRALAHLELGWIFHHVNRIWWKHFRIKPLISWNLLQREKWIVICYVRKLVKESLQDKTWIKMPILWNYRDSLTTFWPNKWWFVFDVVKDSSYTNQSCCIKEKLTIWSNPLFDRIFWPNWNYFLKVIKI